MEKKVYRSRISILIIFAICLPIIIPMIRDGLTFFGIILAGVVMTPCFFAFRSMKYVLTDKELHVYYLWFKVGIIYISGIAFVERSYNPLGAFAVSAKRLRFRFYKWYKWHKYFNSPFFIPILPSISPVREQEFLETLKTLNPDIQINVTDKKGWWRFWDWDI